MTNPKWSIYAMWIGGGFFLLAILVQIVCASQISSYEAAQQSWGGLGELFREFSGAAQREKSDIIATRSFADGLWWIGLALWGVGGIRWVYWALFQRLRFQNLGYGPIAVPGSGFVFQPPAGWTIEKVSTSDIPFCFGKPIAGFRPNIYFDLDGNPGTLEDSLARVKADSVGQLTGWIDISCEWFKTRQGRQGIKLIGQGNSSHGHHRYYIYAFERSDGAKLQVFCTVPVSQGTLFDAIFDQCVSGITID